MDKSNEDEFSSGEHSGDDDTNLQTAVPPWKWRKFYNFGKTLLTLGLLSVLGIVLSSLGQDVLPNAMAVSGITLASSILATLLIGAATFMLIRALIKWNEKSDTKDLDLGIKRHPIQFFIKGAGVAALVTLLTLVNVEILQLPFLNLILQTTTDAFSHINFPGLQAALPLELTTAFAIIFLAAASYFAYDALCRIYNNLWDHHDPNKVPSTYVEPLAWFLNIAYSGGYTIIRDDDDDIDQHAHKPSCFVPYKSEDEGQQAANQEDVPTNVTQQQQPDDSASGTTPTIITPMGSNT